MQSGLQGPQYARQIVHDFIIGETHHAISLAFEHSRAPRVIFLTSIMRRPIDFHD